MDAICMVGDIRRLEWLQEGEILLSPTTPTPPTTSATNRTILGVLLGEKIIHGVVEGVRGGRFTEESK